MVKLRSSPALSTRRKGDAAGGGRAYPSQVSLSGPCLFLPLKFLSAALERTFGIWQLWLCLPSGGVRVMEQSSGPNITDPSSGGKPAFRRFPLLQEPLTSKGHERRSPCGTAAYIAPLCSGQGRTDRLLFAQDTMRL